MTNKESVSKLQLNPRLSKLAQLLPEAQTIADIGTDHGYIPIYAILEKSAEYAIASDINRGPVNRAKINVENFGLSEKISLRLGAGLETLKPNEAQVIVIAGMGGILISEILSASIEVSLSAEKLLLQPMTAVKELREYLCENNFLIEEEFLVAEEDKIYNILSVVPNKKGCYSEKELLLGRYTEKTDKELLEKHKTQIVKKLEIKIAGLKSSCLEENKTAAEETCRLLKLIKE